MRLPYVLHAINCGSAILQILLQPVATVQWLLKRVKIFMMANSKDFQN